MSHSSSYEKVFRYYTTGLWVKQQVRHAVIKGWITNEEYEDITGDKYEE